MSTILKSIPATICADGTVQLSENVELRGPTAAMVTIVINNEEEETLEPALLSEDALADWDRIEEDEAWAYLREVI